MTNTAPFNWQQDLDDLHLNFPNHQKRPLIGITGNLGAKGCELAEGYFQSVLKAGGIPVVIPPFEDHEAILSMLDRLDGILLSGGGDLNPLYMGKEPIPQLHNVCPQRDRQELLLIRLAYNRQIPMLGICRGIQMLTVALGGDLYQDIEAEYDDAVHIKHDQDMPREYPSHTIAISEGSVLHEIMDADTLAVNSFHHQAIKSPGDKLRVVARAADGVIEAVESTEYKAVMGVQWHPECFILRQDLTMMPLFKWLTRESAHFQIAKQHHNNIITLDSHCDTPMFFGQDIQFHQRDSRIKMDLHKMTEGRLDAAFMVAYLPQGERDEESLRHATQQASDILEQINTMVGRNHKQVGIAYKPSDVFTLKKRGQKAILLGVENGYAIGRDIANLHYFKKKGVTYMTLCHNGDNDICDSARGNNEHGGVSSFGEQVILEMNKLGMMVDMSHASEKSFYDALEISKHPIVCTHTCSRALCDHPRNLTDDQMRALAEKNGVAQLTLYPGFLRQGGEATIMDALNHLHHMIEIMGIEHVGIGTDFDGDGGVPGFNDASECINFTRHLCLKKYNPHDIRLLWGGNFLRVMNSVQKEYERTHYYNNK